MSHLRGESLINGDRISNSTSGGNLDSTILRILIGHALLILVTSLVMSVILIAGYYFLSQPLYISNTYVSAARETLLRMNVLLQSPYVLDSAVEKAGIDVSSLDVARIRMQKNISFTAAPGDNRPDARIFLLSVNDPNARIAREVSDLIITKWREGLTPKLVEKERIESDLERQTQQKKELENVINRFDKQVTTYVTPQTNSGEIATPFISMIGQRTELEKRIEDLRYQLDGGSMFTVIAGPTEPDNARRSIGWLTLIFGSVGGSFALVAGITIFAVFWREMRRPIR